MAESGPSRVGLAMKDEVVPSPPKRIKKIGVISGTDDANSKTANALDLDSKNVPAQLKCPSCQEVPLADIIQCLNGHPICLECQLKSRTLECSQCRALMTTRRGTWIKNRMMEKVLDAMWFACPYRKDGCREILSRGQVQSHKKDCHFNGDYVQICKYFRWWQCDDADDRCRFWTCTANPEATIEHLGYHLNSLSTTGNYLRFNVTKPIKANRVDGLLTRQNGAIYLTIAWSDAKEHTISFTCVRLDKPTTPGPGEVPPPPATKAVLSLKREFPKPVLKDPNWKRILPIVSVVEAPKTVFLEKPALVCRLFLKQNLLQLQENERQDDSEGEEEFSFTEAEIEEGAHHMVLVKVAVSIS